VGRPIGFDRAGVFGREPLDEGEVAPPEPALAAVIGELRRERAMARSVFGDDSKPLVSLSSRCTMPGRFSPRCRKGSRRSAPNQRR